MLDSLQLPEYCTNLELWHLEVKEVLSTALSLEDIAKRLTGGSVVPCVCDGGGMCHRLQGLVEQMCLWTEVYNTE